MLIQPIDSYTKLLLHMNGKNGSNAIADEVGHPLTIVATLDTSKYKFGPSSGLFDGAANYLRTASSADFTLGTGDFTLDCWIICPASQGASSEISSNKAWAVNAWGMLSNHPSTTANKVSVWCYNHNAGAAPILLSTTSVNTDVPVHVALVRSGTTVYLFINGAQEDSHVVTEAFDAGATNYLYVGGNAASQWFKGNLDEYRFSLGIARWTGNFTPPVAPYWTNIQYLNARRDRFRTTGVSLG